MNWPGLDVESLVLDASRDINRDYYERNAEKFKEDISDIQQDPMLDFDIAFHSLVVERFGGRRWSRTTITLSDGPNHWVNLFIAISPEYGTDAEAFAKTVRQWYDGDVFMVEHQKRVTWTSDDGRTRDEWETDDTLGGCYLDTSRDLIEQAREALSR